MLAERVVEGQRELRQVSEELARAHGEADEAVRALTVLAAELDAVRSQARGQATRIRLRALRDAAEVSERIAELAKHPAEAREQLLAAVVEAIGRIGGETAAGEGEESAGVGAARVEESNGHNPAADPADVFEGLVEVEVGPLADFAQLVGFEDAASGISATSEISVKRFTKGRATLEMSFSEPVELLRELEERAPFEFRVRDTREDRVVLDLDDE